MVLYSTGEAGRGVVGGRRVADSRGRFSRRRGEGLERTTKTKLDAIGNALARTQNEDELAKAGRLELWPRDLEVPSVLERGRPRSKPEQRAAWWSRRGARRRETMETMETVLDADREERG